MLVAVRVGGQKKGQETTTYLVQPITFCRHHRTRRN
jgi:hypothetical protein